MTGFDLYVARLVGSRVELHKVLTLVVMANEGLTLVKFFYNLSFNNHFGLGENCMENGF